MLVITTTPVPMHMVLKTKCHHLEITTIDTQMSLQPEFAVKPRILDRFCSKQVQSTCFNLVLYMAGQTSLLKQFLP